MPYQWIMRNSVKIQRNMVTISKFRKIPRNLATLVVWQFSKYYHLSPVSPKMVYSNMNHVEELRMIVNWRGNALKTAKKHEKWLNSVRKQGIWQPCLSHSFLNVHHFDSLSPKTWVCQQKTCSWSKNNEKLKQNALKPQKIGKSAELDWNTARTILKMVSAHSWYPKTLW